MSRKLLTAESPTKITQSKKPFSGTEYPAFILNHPALIRDDLDAIFEPRGVLPKEASLLDGDTVTPIIVFCPAYTGTEMPPAYGRIKQKEIVRPSRSARLAFSLKSKLNKIPKINIKNPPLKEPKEWEELQAGWFYLTPAYIYGNGGQIEQDGHAEDWGLPAAFINAIAEGRKWDNPLDMGPYEFGSQLELPEIPYLIRKGKRAVMGERLEKTAKSYAVALVVALIFLIIMQG